MDAIFSNIPLQRELRKCRWEVEVVGAEGCRVPYRMRKKNKKKIPVLRYFLFILKMPEKMLDTYKTEMEEKGRLFFLSS